MNLQPIRRIGGLRRSDRRSQQGSAVLVVLVFLFILELLIMSNARTLDHLQHELRLVEKKQQEKFRPASNATTNQVPVRPSPRASRP